VSEEKLTSVKVCSCYLENIFRSQNRHKLNWLLVELKKAYSSKLETTEEKLKALEKYMTSAVKNMKDYNFRILRHYERNRMNVLDKIIVGKFITKFAYDFKICGVVNKRNKSPSKKTKGKPKSATSR
jgi:hypothetical protein